MRFDLVVAGATGRVGGSLVRRVLDHQGRLRSRGATLSLYGTLSSTAASFTAGGLNDSVSLPTSAWDRNWHDLLSRLSHRSLSNPTFVDCTASPEVADVYPRFLEAGISVVSANKLAWSGTLESYLALYEAAARGGARLMYETTVGSALPMVSAVRAASRSGDEIADIVAVLSGTLSFVLSAVNDGRPFSGAVREARELGLTEPHPREDLSGADVGRKLLILMREAGYRLEPNEVEVESLVPAHLEDETDPERFLDGLKAVDSEWASLASNARRSAQKLVYSANMKPSPRTGVRLVPQRTGLGALQGTENALELRTAIYRDHPLYLSGPGAGPDLTAMGIIADIVQMASEKEVRV